MATPSTASAAAGPAAPAAWLALARHHYENFPVGSWLLPRRARLHLHRIYAFARTADDLADERRDRAALLAFRAAFLRHLHEGAREVPMLVDLVATIRACELPPVLFTDLLDAFEQDCVQGRYDRNGLLDYCRRSANPIGRLVLAVCGHDDAESNRLSDRICTALQLLNHLQDLGSDLRLRDRIYFPREDLERFGVEPEQLLAAIAGPAVRALVRHWAAMLGDDFAAGWVLCQRVRGRLRWELRAILRGAAAVLARIAAVDGDVLGGRVHLTKWERVRTVLAGLLWPRPPRFHGSRP